MVSDRWIPVLAATVGVLGGLGGALIGGLIANEGQQDQLESERDAAREALREEAYAGYLAAANTLFLRDRSRIATRLSIKTKSRRRT
jgi:hypothetical protein